MVPVLLIYGGLDRLASIAAVWIYERNLNGRVPVLRRYRCE